MVWITEQREDGKWYTYNDFDYLEDFITPVFKTCAIFGIAFMLIQYISELI